MKHFLAALFLSFLANGSIPSQFPEWATGEILPRMLPSDSLQQALDDAVCDMTSRLAVKEEIVEQDLDSFAVVLAAAGSRCPADGGATDTVMERIVALASREEFALKFILNLVGGAALRRDVEFAEEGYTLPVRIVLNAPPFIIRSWPQLSESQKRTLARCLDSYLFVVDTWMAEPDTLKYQLAKLWEALIGLKRAEEGLTLEQRYRKVNRLATTNRSVIHSTKQRLGLTRPPQEE